jgi:tRNA pseudouridine55 synthase
VQVPPRFSAIKLAGERAYDLARDGETVISSPRQVEVTSLRLVAVPDPTMRVRGRMRQGDLCARHRPRSGPVLGCFGHVTALRRTAVGPFTAEHMIPLEKLEALRNKDAAARP